MTRICKVLWFEQFRFLYSAVLNLLCPAANFVLSNESPMKILHQKIIHRGHTLECLVRWWANAWPTCDFIEIVSKISTRSQLVIHNYGDPFKVSHRTSLKRRFATESDLCGCSNYELRFDTANGLATLPINRAASICEIKNFDLELLQLIIDSESSSQIEFAQN